MSSPALRLFQRHARIRFANRLHENVADALLKLGWPVSELHAMAVAHDGYLEASMQSQDKEGRNRRIAWAAAEASPENPSHWYELGRACVGAPEGHAEALAAFARVEQLLAAGAELSEAAYPRYVSLYQGLLHQVGRIDEAQALLDEAIARYPGHAELHYRRGLLRTQHGDREGARRDFLACLTPNAYMASQRREGITWELPNRALAELEAQVAADSAN